MFSFIFRLLGRVFDRLVIYGDTVFGLSGFSVKRLRFGCFSRCFRTWKFRGSNLKELRNKFVRSILFSKLLLVFDRVYGFYHDFSEKLFQNSISTLL